MTPELPAAELEAVFGVGALLERVDDLRGKSFSSTVGVWRVVADGASAILKHVAHRPGATPTWPSEDDPASPYWWRREAAVYAEGLPAGLPFALPSAQAFERADGSVALWLEDLGAPPAWSLEQLAEVAALLAAMPAADGLPRGFLGRYLELRADRVDPESPLWARREELLALLDAIPQVLVHDDFHPANVFRRDGAWFAIDWAFCGVGAVGTDAGVLVADGLYDGVIPVDRAEEAIAAVWDAYSGALDPALAAGAEIGFFVGTALRYAWTATWTEEAARIHAALLQAATARLPSLL